MILTVTIKNKVHIQANLMKISKTNLIVHHMQVNHNTNVDVISLFPHLVKSARSFHNYVFHKFGMVLLCALMAQSGRYVGQSKYHCNCIDFRLVYFSIYTHRSCSLITFFNVGSYLTHLHEGHNT